jgi:hypothetical protein
MTTPTIGRIVHVPMDPAENNGSTIAPAVITRVWTDTMVNVRILADGPDTPWRTSVAYVEQLPEPDGTSPAHVWAWPPRV